MSVGDYGTPGNEGPEHSRAHLGRRPYWKRAHRRELASLDRPVFLFAAIIIYVLSDDFWRSCLAAVRGTRRQARSKDSGPMYPLFNRSISTGCGAGTAFGQAARRAAAGRRTYRRSVGTQRSPGPSQPGC